MIIHMPDPHPGRCINLRPGRDANGYPTNRRCLLYENERHVCEFPPNPPLSSGSSGSVTRYGEQAKPWIAPERIPA